MYLEAKIKPFINYYQTIIFSHNDFPMGLRDLLQNDLRNFDFNSDLTQQEPWASYVYNHVDLPRMREGGMGGQVS